MKTSVIRGKPIVVVVGEVPIDKEDIDNDSGVLSSEGNKNADKKNSDETTTESDNADKKDEVAAENAETSADKKSSDESPIDGNTSDKTNNDKATVDPSSDDQGSAVTSDDKLPQGTEGDVTMETEESSPPKAEL